MCLAAVPVMRRQRYGRIINIESMAGVEGGAPADSAPETKGVTVSTM
jgi:NAD(P)-dependent dehydrogenase (short-subunit alcohol dehydrogenase family)